jgi:hypothetical protein
MAIIPTPNNTTSVVQTATLQEEKPQEQTNEEGKTGQRPESLAELSGILSILPNIHHYSSSQDNQPMIFILLQATATIVALLTPLRNAHRPDFLRGIQVQWFRR